MTDLSTQLAAARPTDTDLDTLWSPADRAERLATILSAERRRRRTRRTALPAAAAAVAALALVVPMLDSGDAAAADLHALARSAVRHDGPVLAQGTWLHETSTSVQRDDDAVDGHPPATYAHSTQVWTSWDGHTLVIDDETSQHATEYTEFDDHAKASYQDPTPAFSATLPADAAGLTAYLDARVFGSSSHAEAMYSALTQLAASHTLPPQTLAAAFEALAQIDHVTTSDVQVDGRPAVQVSYDEALTSSTNAYVFDRETGQELSSHDHSAQSDYVSTTTVSEVLASVPAAVLADFAAHRGEGRYDDTTGVLLPH